MGWKIGTAEKEIIDTFLSFIEENFDFLRKKRIAVWGASVRGTIMGMFLEKKGLSDFVFVDNDEEKWGAEINGYSILAPEEIIHRPNLYFIVIPIEHYEDICIQLQKKGWKQGENFATVSNGIYDDFCDEYFRKYENDVLVMGETFLTTLLLEEELPESVSECIVKLFSKEKIKILARTCMGLEGMYHLLKGQIDTGMCPKHFLLFLNFETLSEEHHLLARTQHPKLMMQIYQRESKKNQEFLSFIRKSEERSHNYLIELRNSPKRILASDEDMEVIRKEYSEKQLMHLISAEYEECIFLRKILELCREKNICAAVAVCPINYEEAEAFWGGEFNAINSKNINLIKEMVCQLGADFFDMSRSLKSEDFEAVTTSQDGIRASGREKIARYLEENVKWMY